MLNKLVITIKAIKWLTTEEKFGVVNNLIKNLIIIYEIKNKNKHIVYFCNFRQILV